LNSTEKVVRTMAEYIEREIVLQEIIKAQESLESNMDKEWTRNKPYFKGLAWANRIISETPAADVVSVVRCCECKHRYIPERCALWYGHYDGKDYYVDRGDNFYCSYGERKNKK
jgi:hypothetical protein